MGPHGDRSSTFLVSVVWYVDALHLVDVRVYVISNGCIVVVFIIIVIVQE